MVKDLQEFSHFHSVVNFLQPNGHGFNWTRQHWLLSHHLCSVLWNRMRVFPLLALTAAWQSLHVKVFLFCLETNWIHRMKDFLFNVEPFIRRQAWGFSFHFLQPPGLLSKQMHSVERSGELAAGWSVLVLTDTHWCCSLLFTSLPESCRAVNVI